MSPSSLISELGARAAREVAALADPTRGYALLDFPDYANVGDSLIWLGQLACLTTLAGRPPGYICTKEAPDFATLRRLVPEGPIYLSGGGNFGDVWPRFQAFRERVLAEFPDRRIVQLPQTIRFVDPAGLTRTRALIRAHGNYTMLVRDAASLAIARDGLGCDVGLSPDMAFCLGSIARPTAPDHDVVGLLRTDRERRDDGDLREQARRCGMHVVDWASERTPARLARFGTSIRRRLGGETGRQAALNARARARLARGRALLGAGRVVVTDRLHGHILSVLMGIPHVVLDNSYGKVAGFATMWTAADPHVALAGDLDEALVHARAMLTISRDCAASIAAASRGGMMEAARA